MGEPGFFVADDQVRFVRRTTSYRQIFDVREYRFDDIRDDDRVLDIGANVGAFCIRAARASRYVMAVEPVTDGLLAENIRTNGVPVTVIRGGLGDGTVTICSWDDHTAAVPTYRLESLISLAGGCDFLKCDCEGGEWLIRPGDLDGVRRIEMELHTPPLSGKPNPALLDYISRHYDFEIERKPCHDILGVMGVLHAERK